MLLQLLEVSARVVHLLLDINDYLVFYYFNKIKFNSLGLGYCFSASLPPLLTVAASPLILLLKIFQKIFYR